MDAGSNSAQSISAEALSGLIAKIYDCAIDPARWPVAMEAIRLALDFQVSTLNLQRLPSFEVVLNVTSNVPAAYIPLIDKAGPDVVEQWGGAERIAALPMTEPGVLSWVNPAFDPLTTSNRYYHEFARPQGLVDVLAVMLARDEKGLGSIAWGRGERAGPITEREVGVVRLLTPHLQRAATINRLLDMSAVAAASFTAVIDRLAAPIVLVDARLRIVHANPAAMTLLDREDPLVVVRNALRSTQAGADRALAVAVEAACGDTFGMERKGLEIPTRGQDGEPYVLHVLPLSTRSAKQFAAARAAVFVGTTRPAFIASGKLLGALFSLTGAEARVFEEIAAGHSPSAVAERLSVAPSTVKTHLKRLYQKTGAEGHADLGRIAASLGAPVARADSGPDTAESSPFRGTTRAHLRR